MTFREGMERQWADGPDQLLDGLVHDLVAGIEEKAMRFDGGISLSPGHDGDTMARVDEVSRRSVDDDFARTRFTWNDISFEACAAGNGGDEHFLPLPEVGGGHEVRGDCDAAFIIDVGVGDECTVELGFEDGAEHDDRRQGLEKRAGRIVGFTFLATNCWLISGAWLGLENGWE